MTITTILNTILTITYLSTFLSTIDMNNCYTVVFQPCSLGWDMLVEGAEEGQGGKDPKTVLEHEINKYSSLTAGSTIYIEHEGQEYVYTGDTGDIDKNHKFRRRGVD